MIKLKNLATAALSLVELALVAMAEEAPPAPKPAKPAMREVAPGIFEIGKLRLDQKALSVSFPGKVNMERGLLEYILVNPHGSAHESLLATDVAAGDIHFAMLLLGAKGSGGGPAASPPTQITGDFLKDAPALQGDNVLILVKWKDGNAEKTAPVEDWLFCEATKKAIEHGPWTYNGSIVFEGRFLAQMEGNLVATVTNPAALINNPRKGSDNDQIWNVNEKTVPKVNTPVEIIFKLVPPTDAKPRK